MSDLTREDLEELRRKLLKFNIALATMESDAISEARANWDIALWRKASALISAAEVGIEARATGANSARVPDGWKLVPIEPTPEMIAPVFDTPEAFIDAQDS